MNDIEFYEAKHLYLVDGEQVPSDTTILNYLSQAEYEVVNRGVLDQAARRGSLVHEYTELIDYGAEPEEVEYEVVGYLKAYKDFLRDYRPDWTHIESPVYSKYYGYVGTLDRAGVIDGARVIVDIKTVGSPTKLQKFIVWSQTRAYAVALKEMEMVGTDKRFALYLGKDGEYNLVSLNEYEDKYEYNSWGMFTKCLDLYKAVFALKNAKPKKGKG